MSNRHRYDVILAPIAHWVASSYQYSLTPRGRPGGAMVLSKLPVPGRPTNLDKSRARACCACSKCGWGLFGHFISCLSFLFSFSLFLGNGQYRLKYCLKGPLSPKQTTNPHAPSPSQENVKDFCSRISHRKNGYTLKLRCGKNDYSYLHSHSPLLSGFSPSNTVTLQKHTTWRNLLHPHSL